MPPALGLLTRLEQVDLSDNLLSGRLPLWAGALEYGSIMRLDNNNFTGSLPAAWCPRDPPTYEVKLANNAGVLPRIRLESTLTLDRH